MAAASGMRSTCFTFPRFGWLPEACDVCDAMSCPSHLGASGLFVVSVLLLFWFSTKQLDTSCRHPARYPACISRLHATATDTLVASSLLPASKETASPPHPRRLLSDGAPFDFFQK